MTGSSPGPNDRALEAAYVSVRTCGAAPMKGRVVSLNSITVKTVARQS
jgi:hypothetical protein